jgi:hypothetical protein
LNPVAQHQPASVQPRMRHKLLLITSDTRSAVDGGTVMLRSLLQRVHSDDVVWIAFGARDDQVPEWMRRFKCLVFRSALFHRHVRAISIRSPLRKRYLEARLVGFPQSVKARALGFAREHQITKIWVHAAGPAVWLADALATELDVSLHASLQDDPYGHLSEIGELIEPHFRSLLVQATTADVASDAMRQHYDARYQVNLNARTVLFGGVVPDMPSAPLLRPQARRVAYAGNIWCVDEVVALCDALQILSRAQPANRRFVMTVFARNAPAVVRKHPNVIFAGLVASDQLSAMLGQYDLLYCPMGFDERHRSLTALSFPGKMFAYLQSQIPIIAHGPDYATHIRFTHERDVGLTLRSTDPMTIATELGRYADDLELRRRHSRNARQLMLGPLDPSTVISETLAFVDS